MINVWRNAMEKYKILIVDDDKDIVNLVTDILSDEGFIVENANDGGTALRKIKNNRYHLIILDIMLPDVDGLQICKKIRDDVDIPIIFLSAKNKSVDKVIGFELGADDYITKPFDDNELVSRVKAHLRRQERIHTSNSKNAEIIKYDGIQINKNSFEVVLNGLRVDLSTREFQILCYMMENPNRVLTREQIYDGVWGYDDYGDINTVTVHIKKLREKIDNDGRYIKTIWGVGYKFVGE
ncbi:response regulator receiver domain protein [Clostridiales bacterium oral taxon 876 str. F0540]|nr:response regulator receiver domain protein [Clostridiales bacterium oral taxon 876 str. F0540]